MSIHQNAQEEKMSPDDEPQRHPIPPGDKPPDKQDNHSIFDPRVAVDKKSWVGHATPARGAHRPPTKSIEKYMDGAFTSTAFSPSPKTPTPIALSPKTPLSRSSTKWPSTTTNLRCFLHCLMFNGSDASPASLFWHCWAQGTPFRFRLSPDTLRLRM